MCIPVQEDRSISDFSESSTILQYDRLNHSLWNVQLLDYYWEEIRITEIDNLCLWYLRFPNFYPLRYKRCLLSIFVSHYFVHEFSCDSEGSHLGTFWPISHALTKSCSLALSCSVRGCRNYLILCPFVDSVNFLSVAKGWADQSKFYLLVQVTVVLALFQLILSTSNVYPTSNWPF